jgi:hypothetical protein
MGSMDLEVSKPVPDEWWMIYAPIVGLRHDDTTLKVIDKPDKGSPSLRASKKRIAVLPLDDFFAELVVDGALAKEIAGKSKSLDGVTLRKASLHDAKGKIADGYVHFDVEAYLPLDHEASKATWQQGWLDQLEQAAWGEGRQPKAKMFRLLEDPQLLFVDQESAGAIEASTNKKLSIDDYSRTSPEPFPPKWSLSGIKTLPEAKDAEAAFWALYVKPDDRKARAIAIKSPWWAYAVARCIDRKPANDTRKGACGHPVVAALYAVEVDRGPHPETRKAANESGLSALHYASYIDRKIDPELRAKIICDAGHDESTLAKHEPRLSVVARFLRGSEAPAVEEEATPARKWLKHDVPRYAPNSAKKKKNAFAWHEQFDDAVISDVDAFILRGYKRLGFTKEDKEPRPEEVVERAWNYIEDVQRGKTKIAAKERTTAQMELGSAWGEQLHRALGWQWAKVSTKDGKGGLAVISKDRALAHYPFVFMGQLIAKGATHNTVLSLFNMIADGNVPKSARDTYTTLM